MLCEEFLSFGTPLACHQRLKVHAVHGLHRGQPPLALPDSPAPPSCGSHTATATAFLCLPQAQALLWLLLGLLLCLDLRWAPPGRGVSGKLRRAIPQRLQGHTSFRGHCLPAPCWLCQPGAASGPDCLAQSSEARGPSKAVSQQLLMHFGQQIKVGSKPYRQQRCCVGLLGFNP